MSYFKRALSVLVALPLIALALGCQAQDRHVFHSTVFLPITIELIDTYRSESAWSMDIPVNHKLVMQFDGNPNGATGADGSSARWVKWELYRAGDLPTKAGKKQRLGTLISNDKVDLTGKRVRMVVSYRQAPELPGAAEAAPVPEVRTAESLAWEAIAESKQLPAATQPSPSLETADESSVADWPQAVQEAEPVEVPEETTVDEQVESVPEAADTAEDSATTPTK